jgi:methylenetetrahydrofolate reductase (NADPH)
MTMTEMSVDEAGRKAGLADILQGYSAEVTARDRKSLDAAHELLAPGTEVFIAAIPGESPDRLVAAAAQLRRAGLIPTPHIVARNIKNRVALDDLLERLVGEAGLDRLLCLGGDRDKPEGEFESSLQLLQTGLIQAHGVSRIFLACYPEGHPRIADEVLEQARAAKLAVAAEAGFDVTLISQFCFDPKPVIALAKRMRSQGVAVPFRVGVAGPAERATLVKYALMCGVGASLRALKERQDLARNVLAGETPGGLLAEVAEAQRASPGLGVAGVHFFTFGSLARSARWAAEVGA